MEQQTTENGLYAPAILDFVTVAAEFCKCVEQTGEMDRGRFSHIMRGLIPMLYLKATLLPDVPPEQGFNATVVTEEDYNFVRSGVAALLGSADDYLDVFVEDFKYADQPILRTVSEDLADTYQALRNFLEAFRSGHDEAMAVAVTDVKEEFGNHWGQCVLGALRALHEMHFSGGNDNLEED